MDLLPFCHDYFNEKSCSSEVLNESRKMARSIVILLLVFCAPNDSANGQVVLQDSLALVSLFNSTNGVAWDNNTNWLTGTVSTWSGIVVHGDRVLRLSLSDNNLTGILPTELGDLDALWTLRLPDNALIGSIPNSIGGLTNLKELNLSTNRLTGVIPAQIGDLTNLDNLNLWGNHLEGRIPESLGNLSNLRNLNLSLNHLIGEIPPQLGNMSALLEMKLYANRLWGSIPTELSNLALTRLDLWNNELTGSIPIEFGSFRNKAISFLRLSENQLSGEIPSSLSNLIHLRFLYLGHNELSGSLPGSLSQLSSLEDLHVDNNLLIGQIPSEFGQLSRIVRMLLNNNQFEGPLPSQFSLLQTLRVLDVSNTNMSGILPLSLTGIPNMFEFNFNGTALCESSDSEFQLWLTAITFLERSGCVSATVNEIPETSEFAWLSSYPNPTNGETTVDFSITLDGPVDIRLFDMLSREVAILHTGWITAGRHQLTYNTAILTPGVYSIQLVTNNNTQTRSLVVVK